MSLYPLLMVPPDAVNGMHALPPGGLGQLPLTLPPGGSMAFRCYQLSDTQDFSIRAWLSLTPDGSPQPLIGQPAIWQLNRIPDQQIVVFDAASGLVAASPSLPAPPGTVWLNLLNLVNAENVFSFSGGGVD